MAFFSINYFSCGTLVRKCQSDCFNWPRCMNWNKFPFDFNSFPKLPFTFYVICFESFTSWLTLLKYWCGLGVYQFLHFKSQSQTNLQYSCFKTSNCLICYLSILTDKGHAEKAQTQFLAENKRNSTHETRSWEIRNCKYNLHHCLLSCIVMTIN